MIGSLRGTLLDRSHDAELLVEVGGVGYRVQVTPSTAVMIGEGEAWYQGKRMGGMEALKAAKAKEKSSKK